MKNAVLLTLFCLCMATVAGQQTRQDSITYLDEVILEDPAISRGLGITQPQTLGIKKLNTYGPVAPVAALNQLPGVFVLSGALNTNRITIRGVGSRTPFGTDKIRLYYQNIPVTNGTGFSTIEAFDLENLYAVNVVKGPKATAFGGTLGGTILLRAKEGGLGESRLRYGFTAGSYDLVKNNLSLQLRNAKSQFNLAVNQLSTEGYRENNAFYRKGALFSASFDLNRGHGIDLLVNYIDYNAQIPSSLSASDFETNPTMAAANWKASRGMEANRYSLVGLTYGLQLNPRTNIANTLFYSYLDHYEPRPFNILDEFTNTYGFRSVLNGRMGNANYYFGLELFKDEYIWATYENGFADNNGLGSVQGEQLSDNKEFRRQFFAFTTLNFPLGKSVNTQIGLQLNRTVYDYRDLFNTGTGNKNARREFNWLVLPSLEIQYRPSDALLLHANISRGFSNPSLEETLTPDGIINPEISQATGVQTEVGGKWFSGPGSNLELTLFQTRIKNLLVAERVGEDQFIGRNAGSTRLRGLELSGDFKWPLSTETVLETRLSYTYYAHRFLDFRDGDDDFSGNELTGVPANRLHLNSGLRFNKNAGVTVLYDYVDQIPLTDSNSLYSDAYHLFNLRAEYGFRWFRTVQVQLNFGVQNLFDKNYAQSVLINAVGFGGSEPRYFYPGNGRNFYSGIVFTWSI